MVKLFRLKEPFDIFCFFRPGREIACRGEAETVKPVHLKANGS
jgi:hypothetical protein